MLKLFKAGSDDLHYITGMIFGSTRFRMLERTPPRTRLKIVGTVLLLGISLPGILHALEVDGVPLEEKLHPRASFDDIARKINQQPQWRILAAEPTIEDNKTMYRFKMLNKKHGRVEVIVIDPEQPELEQFNITSPAN